MTETKEIKKGESYLLYTPEESTVIYQPKNGKEEKVFDALAWLAALCSHVPDMGIRWFAITASTALESWQVVDQG